MCALCDARFIHNKHCEILTKRGPSNVIGQIQALKVRVFNDVEFASMNCVKLIACWELALTLTEIFTVWSLRQQLLHCNSPKWPGTCGAQSTSSIWSVKFKESKYNNKKQSERQRYSCLPVYQVQLSYEHF
jgi:hypothetical protein